MNSNLINNNTNQIYNYLSSQHIFTQQNIENLNKIQNDMINQVTKVVNEMIGYNEFETNLETFKLNSEKQSRQEETNQLETYYDKIYEGFQRGERLVEMEGKIITVLDKFQQEIQSFFSKVRKSNDEIGKELMTLSTKIKNNEQMIKGDEYINELKSTNGEDFIYNIVNEDDTTVPQKTLSLEERTLQYVRSTKQSVIKEYLQEYEITMLEKQINRFIDRRIFDSDIHNWNINTSDLFTLLFKKSHIIILIETTENHKFGAFVSNQIYAKSLYISDQYSFIFKIENRQIEKYPIKDVGKAFELADESHENLFVIGKSDIVVKKQFKKDKCTCKQSSFDYKNKSLTLLGRKGGFVVKRIVIFGTSSFDTMVEKMENSLKFNEEIKQAKRMEVQRIIKEEEEKRNKELLTYSMKIMKSKQNGELELLERWTNKTVGDMIFDSDVDKWDKLTSEFDRKIIGKKQLVFFIETEHGEKFGYYLNTLVKDKYNKTIPTDNGSFEFNIVSNGRLNEPMKFEIVNTMLGGFSLFNKEENGLIYLGDIILYKQSCRNQSYCFQYDSLFDYHGIQNALCGKVNPTCFTPKRIQVFQMN